MAKTLLAVDDSVTMRKVLEITFSGEDFRVITAENAQGALGSLGEHPAVFVVDTVLGEEDGYALAKELRKRSPNGAIVMLASRYAPYDPARGRDAGVDDWADKPFDTQQLIDKVRKVIAVKEGGSAQPFPIAAPPGAAVPAVARPATVLGHGPPPAPTSAPSPGAMRAQPAVASAPGARSGTLVFGEGYMPFPSPQSAAQATPSPAAHATAPAPPRPAPAAVAPPAPPAVSSHVGAAVNGQLAGKLGELGLSTQQAEAVLALSRDVVERVVWEVVPQLAEALIKEEIRRLTA